MLAVITLGAGCWRAAPSSAPRMFDSKTPPCVVPGAIQRYDAPGAMPSRSMRGRRDLAGALRVVGERRHHREVERDLAQQRVDVADRVGVGEVAGRVRHPHRDQRHGRHVEIALSADAVRRRTVAARRLIARVARSRRGRRVEDVADPDVGDDLAGAGKLAEPLADLVERRHRVDARRVQHRLDVERDRAVARHHRLRGGRASRGRTCAASGDRRRSRASLPPEPGGARRSSPRRRVRRGVRDRRRMRAARGPRSRPTTRPPTGRTRCRTRPAGGEYVLPRGCASTPSVARSTCDSSRSARSTPSCISVRFVRWSLVNACGVRSLRFAREPAAQVQHRRRRERDGVLRDRHAGFEHDEHAAGRVAGRIAPELEEDSAAHALRHVAFQRSVARDRQPALDRRAARSARGEQRGSRSRAVRAVDAVARAVRGRDGRAPVGVHRRDAAVVQVAHERDAIGRDTGRGSDAGRRCARASPRSRAHTATARARLRTRAGRLEDMTHSLGLGEAERGRRRERARRVDRAEVVEIRGDRVRSCAR